ncbi:PTS transporter subunit EIIC, partial [Vibrio parahaemolyticus]|nr:PTS transporter subunit EIIC [Vibrio parahaemolyticus]
IAHHKKQPAVYASIYIRPLAEIMYNLFYNIKLPEYLGYFAGKRFVPIVTGLSAIVDCAILAFAWPPVGPLLDAFTHWAAYQ